MYPFSKTLSSEKAGVAISATPTPALPNPLFRDRPSTLGPKTWPASLGDFAKGGLINIAGGCCGNTPGTSAPSPQQCPRKGPAPPRASGARSSLKKSHAAPQTGAARDS